MASINRNSLFGKLNQVTYKSIEGATTFCKLRGNRYVELAHWINQIANQPDSDFKRIIEHFDIDSARLAADIVNYLDRLPRGATSISDFSEDILESIERAWVYATLCFGEAQVRTGFLLIGLLETPNLRRVLVEISVQFDKISADSLVDDFSDIVGSSCENNQKAQDGFASGGSHPGEDTAAIAPAGMGKKEALKQFAVNMNESAKADNSDPIVGRDEEIRQIVDILMRRRQNNPILTGEAGVGKTAVVEGFAQKVVSGDVPPQLRNVEIYSLDIGLLQAGASMKGEFENRLKQVIEEVQSSETPIIMFIDEAHTLIGAGGAAGTGDAANLLKPALARGDLRTIAATTWAEYKKYIEKDPALTRRFQVVKIEEPSVDKAILMMRGIASIMEKHHTVQILDESLEAAVKLSHRYIPARQLPDKSVSLLDTAAARVAISQHAIPPELDDCKKTISALETEKEIIEREATIGIETGDRLERVLNLLSVEESRLSGLNERWEAEKKIVEKIFSIRKQLRAGNNTITEADGEQDTSTDDSRLSTESSDKEKLLSKLHEYQHSLSELQGESPFILPSVDEQAVASVVQDWTGIPVGRMVKNEIETVLNLTDLLEKRIIGQRHALEMITKRIQTSRARLDNPQKPIGVFMLAGTSGVGKTETALALAETLYGGEQNIITINMSEFQEAHTVSTLKGSPPGYVGYGEGGILTEAVRRRPYSVVLLDEIEKAHSDVHEIFFQVFDKGWMEDGEGRTIDFKNTIILLTTNAGTDLITNLCKDPELMPDPDGMNKALREPLLKIFPPALLGRLVTIPYYPLSDSVIAQISRLQLDRIKRRIHENHRIDFTYSDMTVSLITERCTSVESGGRMIDTILTNTMLPQISLEILKRAGDETEIKSIDVDVSDDGFTYAYS